MKMKYYIIESYQWEAEQWYEAKDKEELKKTLKNIKKNREHGDITIIYGREVKVQDV